MKAVTISGYFVDGVSAIGGEHTGWELQTASGEAIEVSIEQVRADAAKARQRFVTIRGHFEHRSYTERGSVEVLVAEKITLMKSSGN